MLLQQAELIRLDQGTSLNEACKKIDEMHIALAEKVAIIANRGESLVKTTHTLAITRSNLIRAETALIQCKEHSEEKRLGHETQLAVKRVHLTHLQEQLMESEAARARSDNAFYDQQHREFERRIERESWEHEKSRTMKCLSLARAAVHAFTELAKSRQLSNDSKEKLSIFSRMIMDGTSEETAVAAFFEEANEYLSAGSPILKSRIVVTEG